MSSTSFSLQPGVLKYSPILFDDDFGTSEQEYLNPGKQEIEEESDVEFIVETTERERLQADQIHWDVQNRKFQILIQAAASPQDPQQAQLFKIMFETAKADYKQRQLAYNNEIVKATKRYFLHQKNRKLRAKIETRIKNILFLSAKTIVSSAVLTFVGPSVIGWFFSSGFINIIVDSTSKTVNMGFGATVFMAGLESFFRLHPQQLMIIQQSLIGIASAAQKANMPVAELYAKAFNNMNPFTQLIQVQTLLDARKVGDSKTDTNVAQMQEGIYNLIQNLVFIGFPIPHDAQTNQFVKSLLDTIPPTLPEGEGLLISNADNLLTLMFPTLWPRTKKLFAKRQAAPINNAQYNWLLIQAIQYVPGLSQTSRSILAQCLGPNAYISLAKDLISAYNDCEFEINNIIAVFSDEKHEKSSFIQEYIGLDIDRFLQNNTLRSFFIEKTGINKLSGVWSASLYFRDLTPKNMIAYAANIGYSSLTGAISSQFKNILVAQKWPKSDSRADVEDDEKRERERQQLEKFNNEMNDYALSQARSGKTGQPLVDAMDLYYRYNAPPEEYKGDELNFIDSVWRHATQTVREYKMDNRMKSLFTAAVGKCCFQLTSEILAHGHKNPDYDQFFAHVKPLTDVSSLLASTYLNSQANTLVRKFHQQLTRIYQDVYNRFVRERINNFILPYNKFLFRKFNNFVINYIHLGTFVNNCLLRIVDSFLSILASMPAEAADSVFQGKIREYLPSGLTMYEAQYSIWNSKQAIELLNNTLIQTPFRTLISAFRQAGFIEQNVLADSFNLMSHVFQNSQESLTLERIATSFDEAFGNGTPLDTSLSNRLFSSLSVGQWFRYLLYCVLPSDARKVIDGYGFRVGSNGLYIVRDKQLVATRERYSFASIIAMRVTDTFNCNDPSFKTQMKNVYESIRGQKYFTYDETQLCSQIDSLYSLIKDASSVEEKAAILKTNEREMIASFFGSKQKPTDKYFHFDGKYYRIKTNPTNFVFNRNSSLPDVEQYGFNVELVDAIPEGQEFIETNNILQVLLKETVFDGGQYHTPNSLADLNDLSIAHLEVSIDSNIGKSDMPVAVFGQLQMVEHVYNKLILNQQPKDGKSFAEFMASYGDVFAEQSTRLKLVQADSAFHLRKSYTENLNKLLEDPMKKAEFDTWIKTRSGNLNTEVWRVFRKYEEQDMLYLSAMDYITNLFNNNEGVSKYFEKQRKNNIDEFRSKLEALNTSSLKSQIRNLINEQDPDNNDEGDKRLTNFLNWAKENAIRFNNIRQYANEQDKVIIDSIISFIGGNKNSLEALRSLELQILNDAQSLDALKEQFNKDPIHNDRISFEFTRYNERFRELTTRLDNYRSAVSDAQNMLQQNQDKADRYQSILEYIENKNVNAMKKTYSDAYKEVESAQKAESAAIQSSKNQIITEAKLINPYLSDEEIIEQLSRESEPFKELNNVIVSELPTNNLDSLTLENLESELEALGVARDKYKNNAAAHKLKGDEATIAGISEESRYTAAASTFKKEKRGVEPLPVEKLVPASVKRDKKTVEKELEELEESSENYETRNYELQNELFEIQSGELSAGYAKLKEKRNELTTKINEYNALEASKNDLTIPLKNRKVNLITMAKLSVSISQLQTEYETMLYNYEANNNALNKAEKELRRSKGKSDYLFIKQFRKTFIRDDLTQARIILFYVKEYLGQLPLSKEIESFINNVLEFDNLIDKHSVELFALYDSGKFDELDELFKQEPYKNFQGLSSEWSKRGSKLDDAIKEVEKAHTLLVAGVEFENTSPIDNPIMFEIRQNAQRTGDPFLVAELEHLDDLNPRTFFENVVSKYGPFEVPESGASFEEKNSYVQRVRNFRNIVLSHTNVNNFLAKEITSYRNNKISTLDASISSGYFEDVKQRINNALIAPENAEKQGDLTLLSRIIALATAGFSNSSADPIAFNTLISSELEKVLRGESLGEIGLSEELATVQYSVFRKIFNSAEPQRTEYMNALPYVLNKPEILQQLINNTISATDLSNLQTEGKEREKTAISNFRRILRETKKSGDKTNLKQLADEHLKENAPKFYSQFLNAIDIDLATSLKQLEEDYIITVCKIFEEEDISILKESNMPPSEIETLQKSQKERRRVVTNQRSMLKQLSSLVLKEELTADDVSNLQNIFEQLNVQYKTIGKDLSELINLINFWESRNENWKRLFARQLQYIGEKRMNKTLSENTTTFIETRKKNIGLRASRDLFRDLESADSLESAQSALDKFVTSIGLETIKLSRYDDNVKKFIQKFLNDNNEQTYEQFKTALYEYNSEIESGTPAHLAFIIASSPITTIPFTEENKRKIRNALRYSKNQDKEKFSGIEIYLENDDDKRRFIAALTSINVSIDELYEIDRILSEQKQFYREAYNLIGKEDKRILSLINDFFGETQKIQEINKWLNNVAGKNTSTRSRLNNFRTYTQALSKVTKSLQVVNNNLIFVDRLNSYREQINEIIGTIMRGESIEHIDEVAILRNVDDIERRIEIYNRMSEIEGIFDNSALNRFETNGNVNNYRRTITDIKDLVSSDFETQLPESIHEFLQDIDLHPVIISSLKYISWINDLNQIERGLTSNSPTRPQITALRARALSWVESMFNAGYSEAVSLEMNEIDREVQHLARVSISDIETLTNIEANVLQAFISSRTTEMEKLQESLKSVTSVEDQRIITANIESIRTKLVELNELRHSLFTGVKTSAAYELFNQQKDKLREDIDKVIDKTKKEVLPYERFRPFYREISNVVLPVLQQLFLPEAKRTAEEYTVDTSVIWNPSEYISQGPTQLRNFLLRQSGVKKNVEQTLNLDFLGKSKGESISKTDFKNLIKNEFNRIYRAGIGGEFDFSGTVADYFTDRVFMGHEKLTVYPFGQIDKSQAINLHDNILMVMNEMSQGTDTRVSEGLENRSYRSTILNQLYVYSITSSVGQVAAGIATLRQLGDVSFTSTVREAGVSQLRDGFIWNRGHFQTITRTVPINSFRAAVVTGTLIAGLATSGILIYNGIYEPDTTTKIIKIVAGAGIATASIAAGIFVGAPTLIVGAKTLAIASAASLTYNLVTNFADTRETLLSAITYISNLGTYGKFQEATNEYQKQMFNRHFNNEDFQNFFKKRLKRESDWSDYNSYNDFRRNVTKIFIDEFQPPTSGGGFVGGSDKLSIFYEEFNKINKNRISQNPSVELCLEHILHEVAFYCAFRLHIVSLIDTNDNLIDTNDNLEKAPKLTKIQFDIFTIELLQEIIYRIPPKCF